MLLTAAGLLVIALDPARWFVGFGLVSLAYAMACSALWILVPEFVPVPSLGLAFSIVHVINGGSPWRGVVCGVGPTFE